MSIKALPRRPRGISFNKQIIILVSINFVHTRTTSIFFLKTNNYYILLRGFKQHFINGAYFIEHNKYAQAHMVHIHADVFMTVF